MRNPAWWILWILVMCGVCACSGSSHQTTDFDFGVPDGKIIDSDNTDDDEQIDDIQNDEDLVATALQTLLAEQLLFTNGAGIAVSIEDKKEDRSFTAAAGVADSGTGALLSADMLFRIASITKTFVATALLRLTEMQKLALTDTLDTWYPDYPEAAHITVKMLLNHTSGISDYAVSGTPEEIIAASADMPRYFPPGADWAYSNTNYVFLGRIIEQVSGQTLDEFLRDEVLIPAGLTATSLESAEGLLGTLAGGHLYLKEELDPYTDDNPAWADGGIVSSVTDLTRFAMKLYGGGLLSTQKMDEMTTFVSFGGEKVYGLGTLHYEHPTAGEGYGHNGALINYNGELIYFPKIQTAIALQTNYPVSGDTAYLRDRIIALLRDTGTAPIADDCAYTDLRPATPAARYETLRFKGTVNDISAADPAIGAGYYYYSHGAGTDNLFCSEYAFRTAADTSGSLYLLENCPEVARYYTDEVRIRRVEVFLPMAEIAAAQKSGTGLVEAAGLDYSRMDYWYDTAKQRLIKRCVIDAPDTDTTARFSFCMQRNTDFSAGEEIRLFAYLPFSETTVGSSSCVCFDDQGTGSACPTIEQEFGCSVPEGYFESAGDDYAHLRLIAPINDPAAQIPEAGSIVHELVQGGTAFAATDKDNFVMRTAGIGGDVLIAQSFGDFAEAGNNSYEFKASELIVPVTALVDAKSNAAETLTGTDEFYFGIYQYFQKIRGGEVSYKKCFVAARDGADTAASLLPCYTDNIDFAVGETVKLFGSMQLIADPASLGLYWATTDDCFCFKGDQTFIDCAAFDAL